MADAIGAVVLDAGFPAAAVFATEAVFISAEVNLPTARSSDEDDCCWMTYCFACACCKTQVSLADGTTSQTCWLHQCCPACFGTAADGSVQSGCCASVFPCCC